MRGVALAFVCLGSLVPTVAAAQIVVTLFADPRSMVPSVQGRIEMENTGHAWVSFDGKLDDGTLVHEAWGFAGHMPHGPDATGLPHTMDRLQAALFTVRGGLRPEVGQTGGAVSWVSKPVSDAVYRQMKQTISTWSTNATSYNALIQNCVSFADQIAGDAGLARPPRMATRPTQYMVQLAQLNPQYAVTLKPLNPRDQPNVEAIQARQEREASGIIIQEQSSVFDVATAFVKAWVGETMQTMQGRVRTQSDKRGAELEKSRRDLHDLINAQHQFNDAVKGSGESTVATPMVSTSQDDPTIYHMTPISFGTNYMVRKTLVQDMAVSYGTTGSAMTSAAPDAATELGYLPVELSLEGKAAPNTAPNVWLGFLEQGISRDIVFSLKAKESANLQLFLVGNGTMAIMGESTAAEAAGTDKPSNMLEIGNGESRDVRISVAPDIGQAPVSRLIIASHGVVYYDVIVFFVPVSTKTVELVSTFGGLLTGFGKYFSKPYVICVGPAPLGYNYLRTAVELKSLNRDYPRDCGAWATCDITKSDNENACSTITVQGHNETGLAATKNRDFVVDGLIRTTYTLADQQPSWDLP